MANIEELLSTAKKGIMMVWTCGKIKWLLYKDLTRPTTRGTRKAKENMGG